MPVRAPLPVLLLGATVALLLAVSAIGTPAAAANNYGGGGGRMVIIRAPPPGTTTRTSAAAGGRNRWQQWRRVEDEVAPEFAGLLGAVGSTVASSLVASKQVCIDGHCSHPGQSYTRPCKYGDHCNGG